MTSYTSLICICNGPNGVKLKQTVHFSVCVQGLQDVKHSLNGHMLS